MAIFEGWEDEVRLNGGQEDARRYGLRLETFEADKLDQISQGRPHRSSRLSVGEWPSRLEIGAIEKDRPEGGLHVALQHAPKERHRRAPPQSAANGLPIVDGPLGCVISRPSNPSPWRLGPFDSARQRTLFLFGLNYSRSRRFTLSGTKPIVFRTLADLVPLGRLPTST